MNKERCFGAPDGLTKEDYAHFMLESYGAVINHFHHLYKTKGCWSPDDELMHLSTERMLSHQWILLFMEIEEFTLNAKGGSNE